MNEITINNNNTQLVRHSLMQQLRQMSAPVTTADYSYQECSPRVIALREHADPTALSSFYNTRAEIDLSQNSISLGAIASLPYLDNPTLIDFHQAFPGKAALWVISHISLLNAASGASNRMDEPSLNLCALDIITSFPFITLGEFCVFCARMRSLRYARKRSDYVFSSDTIMHGLWEFMAERKQEIDRYEREHKPEPDHSRCVSWEQARKTDAYKEAYQKKMNDAAPLPRKSVIERIKDVAHTFRPVQVQLTEAEFEARKQEQLKAFKQRYNS